LNASSVVSRSKNTAFSFFRKRKSFQFFGYNPIFGSSLPQILVLYRTAGKGKRKNPPPSVSRDKTRVFFSFFPLQLSCLRPVTTFPMPCFLSFFSPGLTSILQFFLPIWHVGLLRKQRQRCFFFSPLERPRSLLHPTLLGVAVVFFGTLSFYRDRRCWIRLFYPFFAFFFDVNNILGTRTLTF